VLFVDASTELGKKHHIRWSPALSSLWRACPLVGGERCCSQDGVALDRAGTHTSLTNCLTLRAARTGCGCVVFSSPSVCSGTSGGAGVGAAWQAAVHRDGQQTDQVYLRPPNNWLHGLKLAAQLLEGAVKPEQQAGFECHTSPPGAACIPPAPPAPPLHAGLWGPASR